MDATPAPDASSSSAGTTAAAADSLVVGVAALSLEERFAILRGIGEECIQEDELMRLLQNKPVPICYDGFEPSGRMHIAQVRTLACIIASLSAGLFIRRTEMELILLPEVHKTNDYWLRLYYLI
jgi:hypothetical protein